MISQASFVPFQVKEQLGVQAVIAGIHEFECDIITCYADEVEAGLARVQVDVAARKRHHEMRQRASEGEGGKGVTLTPSQARQGTWVDAWSSTGIAEEAMHADRAGNRNRGATSLADGSGKASVDVLVVTALLALHTYPDEGRRGQNLRDKILAVSGTTHQRLTTDKLEADSAA